MATLNFDATAIEPQAPRSSGPLPVGTYTVEITSSEVKELKNGSGLGLNLEFTVIEPAEHANRKVWQTLCIKHEKEDTERIAKQQLSTICRMINMERLADSDQLFGQIIKIRTKIREASGQYPAKAEVAGYEAAGTKMPEATKPAPAAAPAAAAKKPWQK